MNSINKDSLYSILIFLNNKELKNMSYVNKFSNNIIKNNKKLILKNKIIKNWGYSVYQIIPNDYNIDKIIKCTPKSLLKILELYYISVLNDKCDIDYKLFITIYDMTYSFINKFDFYRERLFFHRNESIKNILNDKKIYNIKNDDKKINFIINSTSYFNRFCYFLNDKPLIMGNKEIIDMLNKN